jgi:hypothetical protein
MSPDKLVHQHLQRQPASDACIELNPHVGGNSATAEEACKAVSEFLQALLKLG